MPEINPALVPTIDPGNIFSRFTTDDTLNVRWLVPTDPVIFEAINRPMADIVLRQLIIAKALDIIELQLGHMALFPFLIPAKIVAGTGDTELPTAWIWDMHTSIPAKWELLRLAKIKRISGSNAGGTYGVTGKVRLVFTAQQQGSTTEVALFTADYNIDSPLAYQIVRIVPSTAAEEPVSIDPSELDTVNGFLVFRTLDLTDAVNLAFFKLLAPPVTPILNPDSTFANPTVYEIANTPPGNFLLAALNHGTGTLVVSAYNAIPAMESDFSSWLKSSNYPFRIGATRISVEGIIVPQALFNEFDMVVPASDEPTGDATLLYSPIWLSAIQRVDTLATRLRFIFSTHSIAEDSLTPQVVEFASLTLDRTFVPGRVVSIETLINLLKETGTEEANFRQQFGAGHVVLSTLWGTSAADVSNFFDSFLALVGSDRATFTKPAGIISSYALSRNSRYVPTRGQWEALVGSTARLTAPKNPSDSNRFITESDQGAGDAVDFRLKPGFVDNPDIEDIGYTGSLAHRLVRLEVDASGCNHDYTKDILPRLRCLLGRDPIFGDMLFDGTVFKIYDDVTGAWISI